MKKLDAVIVKEIKYIAIWMLIFSALMQAVFLVVGRWHYTVLLGNLYSAVIGMLNFIFMCTAIQKAVNEEESDAKVTMKASNSLRMLLLFVLTVIGVVLPCFHLVAVLLPLLFPRLAIALRPLVDKNQGKGGDHT